MTLTKLIQDRLGRRGLLLIIGGLSWIGVGISLLAQPRDRFSAPGLNDHPLQVLDSSVFSYLWLIAGIIALVTGVFRDRRVQNNLDSIGYMAFLTPPLTWTLFFVWSFAVNILSGGAEGSPYASYSLAVWTLVSLFILVIAGWPEPYLKTETKDI